MQRVREKIFICYSRAEKNFAGRLRIHVNTLERLTGAVSFIDQDIEPGMVWKQTILSALESAGTFVVLLSPDILISEFVNIEELPRIMEAHAEDNARVFPILASPCQWNKVDFFSQLQLVNQPSSALTGISHHDREVIYNDLNDSIYKWIKEGD